MCARHTEIPTDEMQERQDSSLAMLKLGPTETLTTLQRNCGPRARTRCRKTRPEMKMGFCAYVVEERNWTPVTVRSDVAVF
jgi:hypothetical protein